MENENLTLDEHRAKTVGEILNLLETNDRVCCVRYTGYGKTHFIVRRLLDILKNDNFLILVPRSNLVSNYKKDFIDCKNIKIQTYQYISRNNLELLVNKYNNIDYIICDECHHLADNIWGTKLDEFISTIDAKVLGLTATPIRRDGIDVISNFFNNIETTSLDLLEGIKYKYIPKIKYVRALVDIPDKYDEKLSEIDRYEIENLLNISTILKKHIDSKYIESNYKILLFVSRVEYIQEAINQCNIWFKDAFPNKNINTYYMSSYESKSFNKNQKLKFESNTSNNDIDILVSVDILNEGEHIPSVNTVMMLRKTTSYVVFNQQMGRAINNKQPLIFDLVNNSDYLYTNKQEYNIILNSGTSREKLMFDDYCDLYDETVDIYNICYKYNERTKTRFYLQSNLEYIKRQLDKGKPMNYIADELQVDRGTFTRFLVDCGLHIIQEPVTIYTDIKDNVQNLLNNGMTNEDIANILSISKSTVAKCIKKFDLKIPLNSKTKKGVQVREDYIKNNWNIKSEIELAKDIGTSVRTIQRIADRIGIERESKAKKVTEQLKNRMKDLYLNGENITKISEILNLDSSTISNYLVNAGIYTKKYSVPNIEYYNKFKDDIVKKLEIEGYSKRRLISEYRMGIKTLDTLIKKWNIKVNTVRGKGKYINSIKKDIIIDYNLGLSINKLNLKYGIAGSTIKRYLCKWGILKTMK